MHLVYHYFRFWYNIELSTMLTFFLGVDASPLMTWGAIEGTPMRIDSTPVPSFKMAEPPRREKLAHSLVEKASKQHREKKKKEMTKAAHASFL